MTVVLLIDDQPLVGEAIRRMLAVDRDITCHYCSDPEKAFAKALEIKPTVIVQEIVMHDFDGLSLLSKFREEAVTADVPLMVLSAREDSTLKAEAFARGANDYLVKLPERTELVARVKHHSKGYIHLLERNAANAALAQELRDAESYVRSLLPRPLRGHIKTDWQFVKARSLGGDGLGYYWLDDHRLAIYVVDVGGHGVGPALHSARVMQAMRHQALDLRADFTDPRAVLLALNDAFPAVRHRDMFISVWYGVFDTVTRQLSYAATGETLGALVTSGSNAVPLHMDNVCIGILPDADFVSAETAVPANSLLYVFSDGTYALRKADEVGRDRQGGGDRRDGSAPDSALAGFLATLSTPLPDGAADVERIRAQAEARLGPAGFDDDFTVLRVELA